MAKNGLDQRQVDGAFSQAWISRRVAEAGYVQYLQTGIPLKFGSARCSLSPTLPRVDLDRHGVFEDDHRMAARHDRRIQNQNRSKE